MNLSKSYQDLIRACNHRIMVMAGDVAATFRSQNPTEDDYRGSLFRDSFVPLMRNEEVLSLTSPHRVMSIQREFLEAGADLLVTNTRNANSYGQVKYRLENMAYDMARASATVACEAILEYNHNLHVQGQVAQRKFVVGRMGALEEFAPKATFAEMVNAFAQQACGLLDGGADILWIESTFNSVVGKAALYAVLRECEKRDELCPIMVTKTVTDSASKLLAPHAVKSMWNGLGSYPLFSVGVDCGSLDVVLPQMQQLENAHLRISLNLDTAQLDSFADHVKQGGMPSLNILGGCNGMLPEHVKTISRLVRGRKPRSIPANEGSLLLCGLDPVEVKRDQELVQVSENLWSASLTENAGRITRVNLDETPMGLEMMKQIRGPVLLQSRNWETLTGTMEALPGKGIASSIDLSEGEFMFLARAKEIHRLGFAVSCKPVDERGMAIGAAGQCEIFERMYKLLVGKLELRPSEILFDPVVFAWGFEENCGSTCEEELQKMVIFVKRNLPLAHVMGKSPRF